MTTTKDLRVPAVDGLRAIAALSVVAFHTWTYLGAPRYAHRVLNLVGGGYLGVDMFFVISGFVMFLPFAANDETSLGDYTRRRASRILPAYYVSIVVGLAVWRLAVQPPGAHHPLTTSHGALEVVMHLVMAQAVVLPMMHMNFGLGINGAWWTLTWETIFYGVVPAVARRFSRAPLAWTVAAFVLAAATRIVAFDAVVPGQLFLRVLAEGIVGYGGHFALGMLVATIYAQRAEAPRALAVLLVVAGLQAMGALQAVLGNVAARDGAVYPRSMTYFLGRPLFGIGFGAFLLGAAYLAPLNAVLGRGVLKWIGDRSYGVYLFHSIALGLLVAGPLAHAQPSVYAVPRAFVILVPISLALAAMSYEWIELPAIRWARQHAPRRLAVLRGSPPPEPVLLERSAA